MPLSVGDVESEYVMLELKFINKKRASLIGKSRFFILDVLNLFNGYSLFYCIFYNYGHYFQLRDKL